MYIGTRGPMGTSKHQRLLPRVLVTLHNLMARLYRWRQPYRRIKMTMGWIGMSKLKVGSHEKQCDQHTIWICIKVCLCNIVAHTMSTHNEGFKNH